MKKQIKTFAIGIIAILTLVFNANAQVTSVGSANSSITVSPNTGAVDVGINTAHTNIWTANQTFNSSTGWVFGKRPIVAQPIIEITGTRSPTGGGYIHNSAGNSNWFFSTDTGTIAFGNRGQGSIDFIIDGYLHGNVRTGLPVIIGSNTIQSSSSLLTLYGSSTGAAGTSSMKILPGTLTTVPEPYSIEVDIITGDLMWTDGTGVRHIVAHP